MKSKIGNFIHLLLPVIFLAVLFTKKNKLSNLVSNEMKLQTGNEAKASIQKPVDSLYNVVFMNILQTENQAMMKYYGVAAIPTQVLLDKNGEEFFRHTGYFSFKDLKKVLDVNLSSN